MAVGQFSKYLPFAFTEQGVAMLSSVLDSEREIQELIKAPERPRKRTDLK
jgi:hypothetical protein